MKIFNPFTSAFSRLRLYWSRQRKVQLDTQSPVAKHLLEPSKNPRAWFLFLYPLLNAGIFTPAVTLTADAWLGVYILVALNLAISLYFLNKIKRDLQYDTPNRLRYVLQLVLVLGPAAYFSALGFGVVNEAFLLLAIFTLINIVSSAINAMFTITEITLPFLQSSIEHGYHRLTHTPEVLIPPREMTDSTHFLHIDSDQNKKVKELLRKLGLLQNLPSSDNEDTKTADSRGENRLVTEFRIKIMAYYYAKVEQYNRAFFGSVRYSDNIGELKKQVYQNEISHWPNKETLKNYSRPLKDTLKKVCRLDSKLFKIGQLNLKSLDSRALLELLGFLNKILKIDRLSELVHQLERKPPTTVEEIKTQIPNFILLEPAEKNPVEGLLKMSQDIIRTEIEKAIKTLSTTFYLTSQQIQQAIHTMYEEKISRMSYSPTFFQFSTSSDQQFLPPTEVPERCKELNSTIDKLCKPIDAAISHMGEARASSH